jgi:hypothetical protein
LQRPCPFTWLCFRGGVPLRIRPRRVAPDAAEGDGNSSKQGRGSNRTACHEPGIALARQTICSVPVVLRIAGA